MNRLWKIKHWFKYEPLIAFWGFMAKLFHGLAELNDRLGYLLLGKEKWEKIKMRNLETARIKMCKLPVSCIDYGENIWCYTDEELENMRRSRNE